MTKSYVKQCLKNNRKQQLQTAEKDRLKTVTKNNRKYQQKTATLNA